MENKVIKEFVEDIINRWKPAKFSDWFISEDLINKFSGIYLCTRDKCNFQAISFKNGIRHGKIIWVIGQYTDCTGNDKIGKAIINEGFMFKNRLYGEKTNYSPIVDYKLPDLTF